MSIVLNNYINLIRKTAWNFSKRHKLEYDEVLGVCYEIYCEAIKSYNLNRSQFSTYLTHQLKALSIKMYKDIKNKSRLENQETFDMMGVSERRVAKPEEYERELSTLAFQLIKWIISRDWETFNLHNRLPNLNSASKHFNVSRPKMNEIFHEVKTWWKNGGFLYF